MFTLKFHEDTLRNIHCYKKELFKKCTWHPHDFLLGTLQPFYVDRGSFKADYGYNVFRRPIFDGEL